MADAPGKEGRRALKIKCGAVSRLRKEIGLYEEEAAREAAKVEAMRAADACPHDVKQQEAVQAESAMMIPDCRVRLESALGDLQAALAEWGDAEGVAGSEELTAARALAAEVAPLFD